MVVKNKLFYFFVIYALHAKNTCVEGALKIGSIKREKTDIIYFSCKIK